jgi:GNAT superfamily N-acetyltransferase
MKESTRREVERWWRDLFGVDDALWSSVTVLHPHEKLDDYEGWYVAWRDGGVHVSAPSSGTADEVASLRETPLLSLQTVEFWHAFAKPRGLEVVGPAAHRYLDDDPGSPDDVHVVEPSVLLAIRDRVSEDDWWESGVEHALEDARAVAFTVDGGAAVLNDFAGAPRDVGLLVAPDARGQGLGAALGRAAASYAVRRHGYARWRSRDTNIPSTRAAARLGFEPYATQLAIRRGSSAA